MKPTNVAPIFLESLRLAPEKVINFSVWPYCIPFIRNLNFNFGAAVTVFVGENGCGKTTLLEAIAAACGLPVTGGSKNELASNTGVDRANCLRKVLRAGFRAKPRDAFFFRAEFISHYAELLNVRAADPDFNADPYTLYGGTALTNQSHGEACLSVLTNRFSSGLLILDEPECAISPNGQLRILARLAELLGEGATQIIIATHSAIFMTIPGARIIDCDNPMLPEINFRETSHYKITRDVLANPTAYWRHLMPRTGVSRPFGSADPSSHKLHPDHQSSP